MDVQGYPVARIGPDHVDFDATVKLGLVDEFDVHGVICRCDFARQSVLAHLRVVDVVQVDTAPPSYLVLRSDDAFFSFFYSEMKGSVNF